MIDESIHGIEDLDLFNRYKNISFDLIYLDMITEFFNEFGITRDYKKEIDLKSELHDLNIDYAISGDRMILNHINVVTSQLEDLLVKSVEKDLNIDINKEIAMIGKSMGAFIDTRKVSTYQYFTQRLSLLENG